VIRRKLGVGGVGAVYEADHTRLDVRVAIKTLDGVRSPTAESIERFRREALAASKLHHPHAVRIFDRGETDDGVLWIAMELLEGETLDVWLQRREKISATELVELFTPICEVVGEAHGKGIVHRDLKPQNVMMVPAGQGYIAKVIDFGIAALHGDDSLTDPDLVSGTPRYMAPEQWQGLAHATARSDVYSLGVIAYLALAGRLPLEADTTLAWMNKHRYEEPDDLASDRSIPPGVARAVMQALAKEPARRPADALGFLDALRRGLVERPGGGRRRRTILALGAGVLLAAGAGVAATQWHRGPSATGCVETASFMPLATGNSWTYRITDPSTGQVDPVDKTITIDREGDERGLKAGVRGYRLLRQDTNGQAYRWIRDTGNAVVWDHDEWFDSAGAPTRAIFYVPYRLRVDHRCERRVVGASWTEAYEAIESAMPNAAARTSQMRERWTVEAVDEAITVPAGTFRAMRIHRLNEATNTDSTYWFAPGVGKVKEFSPPKEQEELVRFTVKH
jgi:serine/threonine-protein kinase